MITAKGEEAVVGKEARVVERVHVDKSAEERTDTARAVEVLDQPQPPRR